VAIATASVGIVIGISTLTGAAQFIGDYLLQFSQGNLVLTLIFIAVISIIMGMGLPTVATYVLLAVVAAPAIVSFGVPVLAAHFYVFYFGLMANVTPPVAIPAYAAAGISGANPSDAGWAALKLCLPAFLMPFIFVYSPDILFVEGYSWAQIIEVSITAFIGILLFSIAVENYFLSPLKRWERLLLFASSLMLIKPGIYTDLTAIILVAVITYSQYRAVKMKRMA